MPPSKICNAREPKTGKPPKVLPRSALRSALRNRGAVRSALGSALQEFFLWRTTRRAPSRALSGALLRGLEKVGPVPASPEINQPGSFSLLFKP